MINELIKMATDLDSRGFHTEADMLDGIVRQAQDQSQKAMEVVNYQVREGDSWWAITQAHSPGRTPEENAKLNDMTTEDTIYPCQMLKLWSIPEYEGGANNMNYLQPMTEPPAETQQSEQGRMEDLLQNTIPEGINSLFQ